MALPRVRLVVLKSVLEQLNPAPNTRVGQAATSDNFQTVCIRDVFQELMSRSHPNRNDGDAQ